MRRQITAERLREVLGYDPETGVFIWLARLSSRSPVGSVAGCINSDGYVCIGVGGRLYVAHRLAFLYMTGEFPSEQADHINGDRTDNRWQNLRPITLKENTQNRRKAPLTNQSAGVLGVTTNPGGVLPWRARIKVNGQKLHLGSFATKEEAHAAYVAAKRIHHPGSTL